MSHAQNDDLDYYYRDEVYIEATNHCNIRCRFCTNPNLRYPRGMMSWEVFTRVADAASEHPRVTALNFVGMGETFLNRNIWRMIDYAHARGLKLYCCTNGKWRASREKLQSLLKLEHIHTTLDAVTNDVFHQSRPDTDVNMVIDNLKDILDIRHSTNATKPHVEARMNLFAFNRHQMFDVIHLCRDLGVDSVWIARGDAPPQFQTTLSDEEFDRLPHDFVFTSGFPQSNQAAIDSQTGLNAWRYKSGPQSIMDRIGCNGFTIRWDGTATPCCFDFNVTVKMGDISRQNLLDMWSRDAVKRFEKQMVGGHRERLQTDHTMLCDTCRHFQAFRERNLNVANLLGGHNGNGGGSPSLAEAENLLKVGNLEGAEQLCHQLLTHMGKDPRVIHLMAVIAYKRGNQAISRMLLHQAILESSRFNSVLHDDMAAMLTKAQRFEEAQAFTQTARRMQDYVQSMGREE